MRSLIMDVPIIRCLAPLISTPRVGSAERGQEASNDDHNKEPKPVTGSYPAFFSTEMNNL
jgi:hypothetical protein